MRQAGVPGMSVALVECGEIAWSDGFGVCRGTRREPVRANTVFAVASLSKPPLAHAVVQLCHRGVLDLDTPLAEFDSDSPDNYGLDSRSLELRQVTARHVLSHTSGLGNFDEGDVGRTGFPPGSSWLYSGEGYLYLQEIVEHLTGLPLEEVADAEVFQPLRMTSTTYRWRPDHRRQVEALDRHSSADGHEFSRARAAWSLHTTAPDYARLVVEALEPETSEALLTPQVTIDEALAWGLGWGLAGDVFWHWGDMGFKDFQCVAVASRVDRRGLVCLTNSDQGLSACVAILRGVFGEEFAFPIRAVIERGW